MRSCLQALQKRISTIPKVRRLNHNIADSHKSVKTVEIYWIPGHAVIPEKETANENVKDASRQQEEIIACPYQKLIPNIKQILNEKWNTK